MEVFEAKPLIKILTIDGGGIRGLIPAIFVREIERRCGKPVHELFDIIAGTSTGALITSMVTLPEPQTYSGETLVEYYRSTRPNRFFDRSLSYKAWSLGGLRRPKYPATSHISALQDALGTTARLKETRAEVVIPIYDLRGHAPRTFMFTRSSAQRDESQNHLIWEVVRAASTASGYFPGWNLRNAEGVKVHAPVDGGVYINNPAMAGLSHAVDLLEEVQKTGQSSVLTGRTVERLTRPGASIEDHEFLLVSLGTGFYNEPIHSYHRRRWGFVGWGMHLLDVIFEGQSDEADRQARAILTSPGPFQHYLRLQPPLPEPYKLDAIAPDVRDVLEQAADYEIRDHNEQIDTICRQLQATG
jgi:hypothetical protein